MACSCKKKKGRVSGVSGTNIGDIAQILVISTAVRVASKALINPMLAQVFKNQIAAGTQWVKYVPGAVKLGLGYLAFDKVEDERVKLGAVQVMSEGLEETLVAFKPDLFDPTRGSLYKRDAFAALRGVEDEVWHMSGAEEFEYDGVSGAEEFEYDGVSGQDDVLYLGDGVSGQDDVLYLGDGVSGMEDLPIAIHGSSLGSFF